MFKADDPNLDELLAQAEAKAARIRRELALRKGIETRARGRRRVGAGHDTGRSGISRPGIRLPAASRGPLCDIPVT